MKAYPVGILQFDITGDTKIWPNPVQSELIVSSGKPIKEISVYSLTGSTVIHKSNAGKENIKLDFSHLSKGSYLLEIRFEDGSNVARNIIRY